MTADVERPIGMFDSGFGGLTVARAVIDLLPAEDLVYIGDTVDDARSAKLAGVPQMHASFALLGLPA